MTGGLEALQIVHIVSLANRRVREVSLLTSILFYLLLHFILQGTVPTVPLG
jgi:hypothetical protein